MADGVAEDELMNQIRMLESQGLEMTITVEMKASGRILRNCDALNQTVEFDGTPEMMHAFIKNISVTQARQQDMIEGAFTLAIHQLEVEVRPRSVLLRFVV